MSAITTATTLLAAAATPTATELAWADTLAIYAGRDRSETSVRDAMNEGATFVAANNARRASHYETEGRPAWVVAAAKVGKGTAARQASNRLAARGIDNPTRRQIDAEVARIERARAAR